MRQYHLAIDIGASSGRHILGWLEGGKLQTEEIYRFQNAPVEKAGTAGALGATGAKRLTWDIERLYGEIINGLRKAKERGTVPATVGIDTWGVDYVLLDENEKIIGDAYCYRDGRTKNTVPSVHKRLPFSALYKKTGIQFAQYNTVYQLYDDVRTGKAERAETYLNLPDYFHYRLTGVKKQEYTMATTSAMVNVNTHEYDGEILEKLGYKKTLFQKLTAPGSYVGEFTNETEKAVGYKAQVVLPATHDTASAVLAAPLKGQTPYISSGTWSILGVERSGANVSDLAYEMNYSNEGSVNGAFRLQQNIMGLWIIQQIRHELGDKYDFATLASLARLNRTDETISVNDEKFLAPESMIEAVTSSVGRTLSVGGMAYCVFNSLAQSYAESLRGLEKLTGETFETLNIIGGGSKNALLNELTKASTGKRVVTGPTEGTAIGNLIMQMIGCNEIQSVAKAREIVAESFDVKEV